MGVRAEAGFSTETDTSRRILIAYGWLTYKCFLIAVCSWPPSDGEEQLSVDDINWYPLGHYVR